MFNVQLRNIIAMLMLVIFGAIGVGQSAAQDAPNRPEPVSRADAKRSAQVQITTTQALDGTQERKLRFPVIFTCPSGQGLGKCEGTLLLRVLSVLPTDTDLTIEEAVTPFGPCRVRSATRVTCRVRNIPSGTAFEMLVIAKISDDLGALTYQARISGAPVSATEVLIVNPTQFENEGNLLLDPGFENCACPVWLAEDLEDNDGFVTGSDAIEGNYSLLLNGERKDTDRVYQMVDIEAEEGDTIWVGIEAVTSRVSRGIGVVAVVTYVDGTTGTLSFQFRPGSYDEEVITTHFDYAVLPKDAVSIEFNILNRASKGAYLLDNAQFYVLPDLTLAALMAQLQSSMDGLRSPNAQDWIPLPEAAQ
jgi:hypothetical protein